MVESASVIGRRSTLLGSTLTTAISLSGSRPTTSAGRVSPLAKVTVTLVAPSTTWLLVTMCPCLSQTNPEPNACACGACWGVPWPLGELGSNWNGEPGIFGICIWLASACIVTWMLTTDGLRHGGCGGCDGCSRRRLRRCARSRQQVAQLPVQGIQTCRRGWQRHCARGKAQYDDQQGRQSQHTHISHRSSLHKKMGDWGGGHGIPLQTPLARCQGIIREKFRPCFKQG